MSVLYALSADILGAGTELACVECAGALRPPLVYWVGARLLLFHPGCAAELGPHLIADAREATLAIAPEPHWRRRLIDGVRHRLKLEEALA